MKLRDFLEALKELPSDILLMDSEMVLYSEDGLAIPFEDCFSIFTNEVDGGTLIVLTPLGEPDTVDNVGLPINEIPF